MGAPIKSKAVKEGRNFDLAAYPDDHYIRCSRCGFINQTDRDITAPDGSYLGWGISFPSVTTTYGVNTVQTPNTAGGQITGNTRTYLDGLTGGGCGNCGTFLYNK